MHEPTAPFLRADGVLQWRREWLMIIEEIDRMETDEVS
jgi:hypothetical protein